MSFHWFPRDIKLEIFAYLEPKDRYPLFSVSKETLELIKNEDLWKNKNLKYESREGLYFEKYKRSRQLENLEKLEKLSGSYDVIYILSMKLVQKNITDIPQGLQYLSQLMELSLAKNRIKEITIRLGNLSQLRTLDLSHNLFEQMPPEIGKLSYLQQLDLSNNRIKEIHVSLKNLSE